MTPDKSEAAIDTLWAYLRVALISIAIGPPLATYFLFLQQALPAESGWSLLKSILFLLPLSMIGWPLAYILGGAPAFLSGVFYVATVRLAFKGTPPNFAARALIGAALGFATVSICQLITIPNAFNGDSALVTPWIGASTGAVIAAFIKKLT